MTNFLFVLSSEKKKLNETAQLLPSLIDHNEIVENDGIQILIGDFDDQNYSLEIEDKNYFFTPNQMKHLDLIEDSQPVKSFSEHLQPYIKIDMEAKQVIISTDPLGTDYIYLAYNGGNLYISSQMKYILQNEKELLNHLDYDAMMEYIFSHCILGMKTFFKKIKLLPYNKTITLNLEEIDSSEIEKIILENSEIKYNFPTRYEEMDKESYKKIVDEQAHLFEQYFNILLNKRNENNYFLLSGGLDSRLLITSVEDDLRKKCKGITYDYSNKGSNVINAKRVAKLLDVEHIVRIIDVEDTIKDTLKHMWYCEGVSTHVSSRLVSFLSEVETKNNLYIDGYVGDGQLGGEFFTCIKNKNLRKDSAFSLLKAMQLHNYFFPPKVFEKMAKEKNILKRSVIPELKKHVDLLWPIEDERMRVECLLALTRGRKYAVGGPKTVEVFGTTILPFYHPQIFSTYVKVPYEMREKRNFELDVLGVLDEEIATVQTTSSKFKRLKIVQNALKVVRWFEKKLGISIVPKSSSPIYKWTDKESTYYKFINQILADDNCFIWNLLNKEVTRKLYEDLFNRKSHLELFLSAVIDLEIIIRLFFGLDKPEEVILESENLQFKQEVKILFDTYDLQREIYSSK
ncbi:MAG: hypothetical protein KAU62_15930 [Candidatus Heimdallarchaeota archaeon]|nr:hypothetical protein [Candidatus Heimdallarchaeota archaeon]MCK4612646.1 hypothetical protein [Candidatus Heimdallarchaeota archaeon]